MLYQITHLHQRENFKRNSDSPACNMQTWNNFLKQYYSVCRCKLYDWFRKHYGIKGVPWISLTAKIIRNFGKIQVHEKSNVHVWYDLNFPSHENEIFKSYTLFYILSAKNPGSISSFQITTMMYYTTIILFEWFQI